MMKKEKKIFAFILAALMMMNVFPASVFARVAEVSEDNYDTIKKEIDNNTYELRIINNENGQQDILLVESNQTDLLITGWRDVGENANYTEIPFDFKTERTDSSVVYTESGKDPIVAAEWANEPVYENKGLEKRITYPTDWYKVFWEEGSIYTDVDDVTEVVSLLLSFASSDSYSKIVELAGMIIKLGLKNVYYKQYRVSRATSACVQEYYFENDWYKDANRTQYLYTTKTITSSINLCR